VAALKEGCGRKIVLPAWHFSRNEIFRRHPSHTLPLQLHRNFSTTAIFIEITNRWFTLSSHMQSFVLFAEVEIDLSSPNFSRDGSP
jgi:hypothetical protein